MGDHIIIKNLSQAVIRRSPKDKENPYSQISNELIRDNSISPACRWLIIYLLSHKDGWEIRPSQLIAMLGDHMGRDKVYALLNEAIAFGYLCREQASAPHFGEMVYYLSESAEFKEILPFPENPYTGNPDTEIPYTENQDAYKKNHIDKKEHTEKKEQKVIAQTTPSPRATSTEIISFSFDSKQFVGISDKDLKDWKEIYPAVDINRELKEMVQWILCNDTKAKSKKLWRRFIFSWLQRSNEKSINKTAYQQSKKDSVISRHTGLQQDFSPRHPSKVHDFSDYSQ